MFALVSIKGILTLQLQEDELRDAIVLVFANKQDLPNAMTASELTDQLGLQALRNRKVIRNPALLTCGPPKIIV